MMGWDGWTDADLIPFSLGPINIVLSLMKYCCSVQIRVSAEKDVPDIKEPITLIRYIRTNVIVVNNNK